MRSVPSFGRIFFRCSSVGRLETRQSPLYRAAFRYRVRNQQSWRSPSRPASRTVWAAANGALGAAVFVQLSEKDNSGTDTTGELRMLEASRAEIKKRVDDHDTGFTRIRREVVLFLDLCIWEPICTGLRFLHLVVIFVPVIAAVPIIWLGKRNPDRDNERAGTLLWYRFLVNSMEMAGPAFIKVRSSQ